MQSRKGLFMELLSRFFGPSFLVSSRCSLLYHHLLLLYSMDEVVVDPAITIKSYWTSMVLDFMSILTITVPMSSHSLLTVI
uniref:Uncharacterized protein n=1 Tax=Brassica campestris TaxID=3711 RepID=A0A3P6DU30_BRACM|nr:unnamed protein product [Brassica rapa]